MKKSQLKQIIKEEIQKVLNETFINNKGELEDFPSPSDQDVKDAAKLQSLGFEMKLLDPDEKHYYLELPDGRISYASKDKEKVLRLKTMYPDTWKNAILKYDNKWLNEAYIDSKGELQDFYSENDTFQGWKKNSLTDPEYTHLGDGKRIIASWSAPMEGWDKKHKDTVDIIKYDPVWFVEDEESDPKEYNMPEKIQYFINVYIAFGDFKNKGPFDSFEQTKKQVIDIINDIKKDWR